MENVVMMAPSTMKQDVSDDESENISLDLHVSDTEDSTSEPIKKETMLESEDEILNKFIDEDEDISDKSKLVNGHSENGSESEAVSNKDHRLNDDQETKENIKETLIIKEEANEEGETDKELSESNQEELQKVIDENIPEPNDLNHKDEENNDLNIKPTEKDNSLSIQNDVNHKDEENSELNVEAAIKDNNLSIGNDLNDKDEENSDLNLEVAEKDNNLSLRNDLNDKDEENSDLNLEVTEKDNNLNIENENDELKWKLKKKNTDLEVEKAPETTDNPPENEDANNEEEMEIDNDEINENLNETGMEESKSDDTSGIKEAELTSEKTDEQEKELNNITEEAEEEMLIDENVEDIPKVGSPNIEDTPKVGSLNIVPSDANTTDKPEKSDEDHQDDGDLLQVMETSFVDEPDKDENSCSSSEKDENTKEDDSEETLKDDSVDTLKDSVEETEENDKGIVGEEQEEKQDDKETREEIENDKESRVEMEDGKESREEMEVGKESREEMEDDKENREEIEEHQEQNKEGGPDEEADIQDKEIEDQSKEDDQNDAIINGLESDNLEGCENDDSHDVDIDECPMDIEENDIGGVIITDHDKCSGDLEEAKDNEETTEVAPAIIEETCTTVVNGDNAEVREEEAAPIEDDVIDQTKKATKRPRSEDVPPEDSKKMKLESAPKTNITRTLNSFKQYMKDKSLKTLTRFQLEELCLQKFCECLVDKSELAELRQKVKALEQTIDAFRKEAQTVANQTRDLKIVHEKVTAALKAAKEVRGKHLVPVKITRSVGLQAVLEHTNRRHSQQNGVVQNGRTNNNNNNNTSNNNITNVNNNVAKNNFSVLNNAIVNNNVSKSPVKPQQSPATPLPSKPPVQRTPVQTNNKPTPVKENRIVTTSKPAPTPKAVIDLTDEDDKMTASSPTNRTNNRVNNNNNNVRVNGQNTKTTPTLVTTTTQNGPKLMMIGPSSVLTTRPVMLKVNSNVVSQANGITIPPTSQVSILAQPATAKTTQSTRVGLTNVTTSRSPPVQKYRHPAPLPLPPPLQNQITTQRPIPPRPHLNLTKSPCGTGIVLQWKMPYQLDLFEVIVSYQLYAYQETKNPPRTDSWGKIGDVKALELPMAVTLTQFAVGNRYYFAVRAVDVHKRLGPFSDPQTILL